MSLGAYLIGAVVAFIIVPSCYSDDFCDAGPPGTFCLLPNLEGYRQCVYNPKTGKIDDVIHKCPANTRCKCMGIPCSGRSPLCGSYTLPPVWPQDYTIDANENYKVCSPAGCNTKYGRFAIWRDTKHKKFRQDNTIAPHDPAYEYWIVLANNKSSYDQYHIVPSKTSCTKSLRKDFPAKIIDIPPMYQYNGTEVVTGINTNRWIWKEGGRNYAIPIVSAVVNTYNGNFLQYRFHSPGSQMSKTTIDNLIYAGTFVPGTPDQEVFVLPNYCEKADEIKDQKTLTDFSVFKLFAH